MTTLFTSEVLTLLIEAICYMLLHSLWQIPIIALIIKLLTKAKVSRSTKASYTANLSALALSLIAAGFTLSYYLMRGFSLTEEKTVLDNINAFVEQGSTATFIDSIAFANTQSNWIAEYGPYITLLYLIGVIVLSSRVIMGYVGVQYLKRNIIKTIPASILSTFNDIKDTLKLPAKTTLALSKHISVPMVIGHIKPIILIPIASVNHLSTEEVEAILIHEATHILQNDYLRNIIVMLTESLFFYHPVIWILSKEIKEEREHICDDMVISLYPDRMRYAKTLVKLQEYRQGQNPTLSLALFNKKFQLMNRVQRILNLHTTTTNLRSRISMVVILLVGTILLTSASLQKATSEYKTTDDDNSKVVITRTTQEKPSVRSISKPSESPSHIDNHIKNVKEHIRVPHLTIDKIEKRITAKLAHLHRQDDLLTNLRSGDFLEMPERLLNLDYKKLTLDTLPSEELERLKSELKETKAKLKERNEVFKKEIKSEKDRIKEIRKQLREQGHDDDEEFAKYLSDLSEWGQRIGLQFSENFDEEWESDMAEWGEEMEAWGEEFGENFEAYMTEHEVELEEWGEKLEALMDETFDEDWGNVMEDFRFKYKDSKNSWPYIAPPAPPAPPAFSAPPAPPVPPSVDIDGDELISALEADGLLTKKRNKIILKNYEMTVNGNKQSQQTFDKYMHMFSDAKDNAFEEGSDTEIIIKTALTDGTHDLKSLSISTSNKR